MNESFDKLVIRSHEPRRHAIVVGCVVVLALLVLYGMFELGRYDAGFRVVDSIRDSLALHARVRELDDSNDRLRTQLEAADVARRVDRAGYGQIEHSLGDMQSQIARLNQDLSFYRGLVQPETVGVKVQRMQIVPDAAPDDYRVKFVLMEAGKTDANNLGNAIVTIEGLQQGRPAILSFARVSPKARIALSYSFRYFQDFDEIVHLPAGFGPTRINVEIHPAHDGNRSSRQAFIWKTQGVSVETEASKAEPAKGGINVVQTETE